jgi:hypothetical protein
MEIKMKTTKRLTLSLALVAGALSFGLLVQAQPPGGGSDRDRRGPPPEAFEACSGASEGEACTVETPHGTLEGTCQQVPDADELACAPNDHRGGPPRGER